ncbi:MAG TPA: MEDS domain-containing protein [Dinghuibacter sp.]|uniref:MEDS domain-containing protein n=1 Tax=Dinghuibacter sp. TaxID=2024697 RepID=UPI002CC80100|nr:MEDS domain-containing protein [Dinghuibacter sp.]HTJ13914.1 MEDS domain-containing protein [Dinghuibacter sp.]
MDELPRHQCLIYDGSPSRMLPAIAAQIKQKLGENFRCLYLNSPTMVAGIRSYLYTTGVNVESEVARGGLILSSETHLKMGRFEADHMMGMLEETMNQALNDGYVGLWATGDMSWELGPDKDFLKLVEYEWMLEQFFQKHATISGICQYHAGTLPREAMQHGLLSHPTVFINETLSRINPYYIPSAGPLRPVVPTPDLEEAIDGLFALQPGEDPTAD